MREIKLTKGYVAFVDDKDYDRVSQFKWQAKEVRRKDGSVALVYAERTVRYVQSMHRFILGIEDPKIEVDHRNHDGLHNVRGNLRKATGVQNQQNSRAQINNTSGFKCVSWDSSRSLWRVSIAVDGKRLHIGRFKNRATAVKEYNKAAKKNFGEFAYLQKVPSE